jgi:hypothetical protein
MAMDDSAVPDLPPWDDAAWGDLPRFFDEDASLLDELMADMESVDALVPAPEPGPRPAPAPLAPSPLPFDAIVASLGSGLRAAMTKTSFSSIWLPLFRGRMLTWTRGGGPTAATRITLLPASPTGSPTHYDVTRPAGLHALVKAITNIEGKLGWWDTLVVQGQCGADKHAVWQLHLPTGTWHRRMDSVPPVAPFQEQFRMDERGLRALSVCVGPLFGGRVAVDTPPTSDVWVWLPTDARTQDVHAALHRLVALGCPLRTLVADAKALAVWHALGPALVLTGSTDSVWAIAWQPQLRRFRLYWA